MEKKSILPPLILLTFLISCQSPPDESTEGRNKLAIRGDQILYNEKPVKMIGLRCSNALIADKTTEDLIESLDMFKSYGLNTVAVYMMGSRFGDVKGYRPDGSMDSLYLNRLQRILEMTGKKDMMVIVGCLYWGTSEAKKNLDSWDQENAETAVANTAEWLKEKNFSHVILDPDNEGMAVSEKGWEVESLISAAKKVNPDLPVANNTKQNPSNEDLNIHFGNREAGKPYVESESTPDTGTPGGYWGKYSKETHQSDSSFYNYSRIGRYTIEMKEDQINKTTREIKQYNGILLASTWIQCGPAEGINGPFSWTGGHSNLGFVKDPGDEWNTEIDKLHPDAGILWWLEFIRDTDIY
jgi:hypothetical protein